MHRRSPEVEKKIGVDFRNLRKEARLNQTQLGVRFGVTAQQISKYERGESPVLLSHFRELQWLAYVAQDKPWPVQTQLGYEYFAEGGQSNKLIGILEQVLNDVATSISLARSI